MRELIIIGFILGILIILGLIQTYVKKPKNIKENFCVLFNGRAYILPSGSDEEYCIEFLGTPSDAQREKNVTTLTYIDEDKKKLIKIYFKGNKIQDFDYEEIKG